MGKYRTDKQDLFFTLFEILKVQEGSHGLEEADIRGIVEEYDKFVANEAFPSRESGDHQGVKLEDGQVKVPESYHQTKKSFYENGWFGLGLSEEVGGVPVPESIRVTCNSLLTGANVAFSMYPSLTYSAYNVIHLIGTDEQKQKFTPPIVTGEWGGTMCLTEAGAGSDVGNLRTTATPNDDGSYSIKGQKIFISGGDNDLYDNIIHLVLARTPGGEPGTKGISLFIVPKFKVNDDGSKGESNDVLCSKVEEKMGIHGSATCVLNFGDKGDCQGYLLGKEFDGMKNMFIMMNEARLLCGVQGEAQACLAYEMSLDYARERSQFGTEIIKLPDVQRMLLKMRAMTRGLRALDLYAASLFDKETSPENEAEIALLTPICKIVGSDFGFDVCVDAVQIHGGYGFCSEYGVEQFIRDTKIASIYEGTNAIQSMDFVTRKILKDQGKAFSSVLERIGAKLKNASGLHEGALRAMGKCVADCGKAAQYLGGMAQKGDTQGLLSRTTDFATFCGYLFVGWRLLEAADLAQKSMANAGTEEEKAFFQSKVDDFGIYVTQYLTRNQGLLDTVQDDSVSFKNWEVK